MEGYDPLAPGTARIGERQRDLPFPASPGQRDTPQIFAPREEGARSRVDGPDPVAQTERSDIDEKRRPRRPTGDGPPWSRPCQYERPKH
jgi:hypothetical protein